MGKKLSIFFLLLASLWTKAQCPQVYNYLGVLSSNPYWVSCTGSNYLLNFQSNVSWGAYTIDWGDGTSVHNAASYTANSNITHNYSATVDTFVVTLSIPSLSCTMTGVVVMEKPVNSSIQIPIGGVTQACAPATLQFVNASTDVSQTTHFLWDFGDGSSPVPFTYTNAAQTISHTYSVGTVNCQTQVTLQAWNYCSFGNPTIANFNPIQIYDKDVAAITPSSIIKCWPSNVFTFTNTTTRNCLAQGNTFQRQELWNFGNYWGMGHDSILNWSPWPPTTPISIAYPSVGTYSVMLVDSNFCGKDTQVVNVSIINPPVAGVVAPSGPICVGASATFTNSSASGYFYKWNFGDGGGFVVKPFGSQSYTYASAGTYTVKVVAYVPGAGTCADTAQSVINVLPRPTANFTYSPVYGCNVLNNVTFTDASSGATSWNWNFGNGNLFSGVSPSAQNYSTIGTSVITLTVTAANSCIHTKTASVIVYQKPVAAFLPASACQASSTTFTDQTVSAATNTINTWLWNFGDGSATSSIQNPVHTYTASGTFTVDLVVNSAFCGDTVSVPLTVNVKPVAAFTSTPSSGCPNLVVSFNNSSLNANSYVWDFGVTPTATSSASSPSFTFANTTTTSLNPTITLIAFTSAGCSDTAQQSITVFPKPVASFTANSTPGCSPLAITFTNASTGATTNNWDFGDGNLSGIPSPAHTYTNSTLLLQTDTVELVVTNGFGCKDTASMVLNVYPKPLFSFTMVPASGCTPLQVNFPPVLGAVAYNWDFGDGNTSSSSNPTHTYTNSGVSSLTYTVTLIAGNAFGCSDTAYGYPIVHPLPLPDFTYSPIQGCSPLQVNFTNTSTLSAGNSWDFKDGNISSTLNPSHTFTTTSATSNTVFNVQLLTTSANGCKDSVTHTVTVFPLPVAGFNVDTPACSPKILHFTNTSVGATVFSWDFGNSGTSAQINPTQQYINSGSTNQSYTVQLISANANNCSDTVKFPIFIHPKPVFNIISSPDSGCAPLKVNFPSIPGAASYSWNFGDGNSASTGSVTNTFVNATTSNKVYTVQLIAANGYNCFDTSTKVIKVFPQPVANFTAAPVTVFVPNQSVTFTNLSTGYISSNWNFGDGGTSTIANPVYAYSVGGEYTVQLIVTSSKGCRDTAILSDKIIALEETTVQVPNAFTPNLQGSNGGAFNATDLNNDVFHPIIKGVDKKMYELSIYSRWGELLFETKDVNIGWDGYYRGKLCTQDVYVWKIKAITIDGQIIDKTGDVLLLK